MLILKLTIDRVTLDGVETMNEGTLTVRDASVLAEGLHQLFNDVFAYASAEPTEDAADDLDERVAPPVTDVLTERDWQWLRRTIENAEVRGKWDSCDPQRAADDLELVLPILRRLVSAPLS